MEAYRRQYFLTSPRIGFAVWQEDDLALAQSLWGNKHVSRLLAPTGAFTASAIRSRFALERENHNTHGVQCWPIFHRAKYTFMGCCGLRPRPHSGRAFEVGCNLLHQYWSQGYGTEAVSAATQYAVHIAKADAVFAGHHAQNSFSRKLVLSLGFVYAGEEYHPLFGTFHPLYVYPNTHAG